MKKSRSALLFVLCCAFSIAASAQTSGGYFQSLVKEAKTRIKEISLEQFKTLRASDPSVTVVDVREDSEWDLSRIPGAIHVGRGVLESRIENQAPRKASPVVVYCRSGARSAAAADVLMKMGYTNVYSLAGGITGYEAAGMPVETGKPGQNK